MTDQERKELRELQDRFVAHPAVQKLIERDGAHRCIAHPNSPTFEEIRTELFPAWRLYFEDSLR